MTKLEYQINNQLVWPYFGEDLIFLYDYTGIDALKDDLKETADSSVGLSDKGIMTINEIRKKYYNMDDIAWGDTWYRDPMKEPVEKAEEPVEEIKEEDAKKKRKTKSVKRKKKPNMRTGVE